MESDLHIGIVGAGGFARFAANAFTSIPGVIIVAVNDIDERSARQLADQLNAKAYCDYEKLLADKNVELVYIATPPYLHYHQSKMALLAGKHVICEKPAALHITAAEELQVLAKTLKLLYVVNLMQRYNPLYKIVKTIIEERMLGQFLHGFFENYASDENLHENHWFWDNTKSGGIFIEHGVHFFDMFSGWLGEGQVINALQLQRHGVKNKIVDRVQASVKYKDGIVNFYHGFDQPKVLDRQEMRLQFEKGEITLYEWVPVKMKLHGLLLNEQLQTLHEMLGDVQILFHNDDFQGKSVKGRFTDINYDKHVTIEYGNVTHKQNRYGEILIEMLNDQWKWINNRDHERVITDKNAVESLRTAEDAKNIVQNLNFKN